MQEPANTSEAPDRSAHAPEPVPEAAPAGLSAVADGVHHRLDPRSIPLGRISGAIGNTIVVVVLFWVLVGSWLGALFDGGPAFWVALVGGPAWLAVVGALAWLTWRMPEIAYRHESYCVDARGIELRRGIVWRRIINVPRTRVQHLDVSQGPLERRFGLGTLVIHTAGTQHAKVELSGLEHGRALRIREHLLPTGTSSDAV
jgi:membrane protein YdbS with pleckstrin-like domain